MARRPREHRPGAVYHAYSRGNNGQVVFLDDDDRTIFLAILADVCMKTRTKVLAYCLMSNHFHLLLEIALASLESLMRRVMSRYSRAVNRKHRRFGHVFQARYKAKICRGDGYYRKLLPYIHRNPVKAGMVAAAADWVWSSARQFEGPIRSTLIDIERALSYLDADPAQARSLYADGMGTVNDDFEPTFNRKPYLCWRENPLPRAGMPMETMARVVEEELGVGLHRAEAYVRPVKVSQARRQFAHRALSQGHSASAIATFLGLTPSGVCRMLRG